jgi:hypothetical protein
MQSQPRGPTRPLGYHPIPTWNSLLDSHRTVDVLIRAFPEPGDGSTVSCRLDAQRLPGSYRSEIGTWQDRVAHVPSHISRLAGRDRSTRGRTAETHATRARLNNDGPVRQCLGLGQAQSQSPNRATPLAKTCESRGLHSINKGNCVAVPPIGQFWTVAASAQLPVTL